LGTDNARNARLHTYMLLFHDASDVNISRLVARGGWWWWKGSPLLLNISIRDKKCFPMAWRGVLRCGRGREGREGVVGKGPGRNMYESAGAVGPILAG
jgi:hypothetical protein